jgi:hypothetical protein
VHAGLRTLIDTISEQKIVVLEIQVIMTVICKRIVAVTDVWEGKVDKAEYSLDWMREGDREF